MTRRGIHDAVVGAPIYRECSKLTLTYNYPDSSRARLRYINSQQFTVFEIHKGISQRNIQCPLPLNQN